MQEVVKNVREVTEIKGNILAEDKKTEVEQYAPRPIIAYL